MKKCVCDEMIAKTETGTGTVTRYREHIALSWDCQAHGRVSVDFRPSPAVVHKNHTHLPSYEPEIKKHPHFPTRRVSA
jgi:hypothetical protein